MNKVVAKSILWVLVLVAIFFCSLPYVMSWLFTSGHKITWEAMSKEEFICPKGYEVTNRNWSKAGYMRYCEPNKNGEWEAWSNGRLQIKGEYKNNKQHGTWQYFNKKGEIEKAITFENGQKVEEK